MDQTVAIWILEYLLRHPIDDKVINGVLSSLPLSNTDYRLKKTILLRRIESETSNRSVSEKLLEILELIEELDHREGKTASHLMRSAYCAVAVDCTVRYLEETVVENGKYLDAVERVWRERVCKVEGLGSVDLRRWMVEIEAAGWDSGVSERILGRNTRNEALKAVRVYLNEAWRSLGPSVLDSMAERLGASGGGVVDMENRCRELVPFEETQKGQVPLRRKHVAIKCKRRRGVKLSDADEGSEDESLNKKKHHSIDERNEDELINKNKCPSGANVDEGNNDESLNKSKAAPPPETERVQAALKSGSVEQNATVRNNVPVANQTALNLTSTLGTNNINVQTVIENQAGPKIKATPEVDRVKNALKSSSMELHAAVRDPLPDAVRMAQTLSSTVATSNVSRETVVEKQTEPQAHAPRGSTENNPENAEKQNRPTSNAQDSEGQTERKLCDLPRRSLMEANSTSHTLEWDDSIDNLPGSSPIRPRLPSPKETRSSPLKNYNEITKFSKRRARKMWTPLEEDTLRSGVQKFGKGNWKLMLHCFREIFQERTEVDLKDKWRNMTRS